MQHTNSSSNHQEHRTTSRLIHRPSCFSRPSLPLSPSRGWYPLRLSAPILHVQRSARMASITVVKCGEAAGTFVNLKSLLHHHLAQPLIHQPPLLLLLILLSPFLSLLLTQLLLCRLSQATVTRPPSFPPLD
jgi:hypothetical protein